MPPVSSHRANIVHDQYFIVEERGEKEWEHIVKCRHCRQHQLKRKADRMTKHLLNECPKCPEDIKEEIKNQRKETAVSPSKKKKRDRKPHSRTSDDDDDDDDDDFDIEDDEGPSRFDADSRVVKILAKLLENEDGEPICKKKLSDMTVEELDREQKEQNIRLTRLKCERVKDKSKRDATLVSSMERIAKSLEAFTKQSLSASQSQPTRICPDTIVEITAAGQNAFGPTFHD